MVPMDNPMLDMDFGENDVLWNTLQEPARPASTSSAYLLLLAALDTGWRILEPVYLSAHPDHTSSPTYLVLLHKTPLISIRRLHLTATTEIELFLKDECVEIRRCDIGISDTYTLYLS
jgi:hypothetical protein